MTRLPLTAGLAGSLACLALSALVPSGCATEEDAREAGASNGATGNVSSAGRASGGSGGKPGSSAGANSGGTATGGKVGSGGASDNDAGATSEAGDSGVGGLPAAVDKCKATSDCKQVVGSCFVCEAVGAIKDCVDQGPPVCDSGKLDPCEVCEIDDVKDCTELGEPGEFSGGQATCKATCDGWDT